MEVGPSEDWDIAFRRTDIYLNSGTSGTKNAQGQRLDASVSLDELNEAPEHGYFKDGQGTEIDVGASSTMEKKSLQIGILMIR